MRYNTYQSSTVQNRRLTRHTPTKVPSIWERLAQQFLTQLTLCVLMMGMMFGAKLLGVESINKNIQKLKHSITYSPSLKEIAELTKQMAHTLIEEDKNQKDSHLEDQKLPQIIIDDEVF